MWLKQLVRQIIFSGALPSGRSKAAPVEGLHTKAALAAGEESNISKWGKLFPASVFFPGKVGQADPHLAHTILSIIIFKWIKNSSRKLLI
jgi:hypothetical protein